MIVFVTAYDRFAVQAFEARAIDYVLKPVDDARLAATLAHVRELVEQRTAVAERNQLVNLLAELRGSGEIESDEPPAKAPEAPPNWLPIRNGRETVRVPVREIEWVDAAGDYLCIHAAGNTHILRATMREMETLLDPRLFQRVHRSTIVNLTRVKSLRAHMNGEYFLRLEGGQELKLSRTYRDKVEYFLKRPRAHGASQAIALQVLHLDRLTGLEPFAATDDHAIAGPQRTVDLHLVLTAGAEITATRSAVLSARTRIT